MQHSFGDFVRHGGDGQYVMTNRGEHVTGRRRSFSLKSTFPNYSALREEFDTRLDRVTSKNTRALLNALTPPDSVPVVTADDLRDVSDAKDEALRQWGARLESIFSDYHNHPQRLRPLRVAMEERLLRAFSGLINQLRQEELGIAQYIWRSQDDDKVRGLHQGYDDRIIRWDAPPEGGHPGQAHNCRCYAEPVPPGVQSPVVLADFAPDGNGLGAIEALDDFLSGLNEDFSVGIGVRPQSFGERLQNLFQPEPGVTIDGEMLDIQTQGDLATALQKIDDEIRDDPDSFLALLVRHGDCFSRLAPVFGISNPGALAAATTLSAADAPGALVDQALTQARNAVDRFVGGTTRALADIAQTVRNLPDIRLDDLRRAAEALYADPSALPEAMVEPFQERIAAGDYAGALGYGLPEVIAGAAALGRVRRRADTLSAPETLTLERLRTDPDFEGITNAGPNAPKFEKWINRGGAVELMPDGHFRYSAETDLLGQKQRVSVEYPGGYPDFRPFMTHPSGVRSVEIEVTGSNPKDFRRANEAAGHPEWGSAPPSPEWTWHHVEDARTMQLVPFEINDKFYHRGGASVARKR
ncbi:HNH endonuclease [Ruegeria sp. 2012CJ41-6]|uniref:HNH endonuclease n=1 Tax=Ruegeria spongiae TaxID=2942209 RepID=A0ABT0PWC1_9RHOB|nr:HNH endonuclease [Ruegeria spongiae]MCL6281906.1 HNH endonuclease [Ruegeria spongiae]